MAGSLKGRRWATWGEAREAARLYTPSPSPWNRYAKPGIGSRRGAMAVKLASQVDVEARRGLSRFPHEPRVEGRTSDSAALIRDPSWRQGKL